MLSDHAPGSVHNPFNWGAFRTMLLYWLFCLASIPTLILKSTGTMSSSVLGCDFFAMIWDMVPYTPFVRPSLTYTLVAIMLLALTFIDNVHCRLLVSHVFCWHHYIS